MGKGFLYTRDLAHCILVRFYRVRTMCLNYKRGVATFPGNEFIYAWVFYAVYLFHGERTMCLNEKRGVADIIGFHSFLSSHVIPFHSSLFFSCDDHTYYDGDHHDNSQPQSQSRL